ncbi:MAG: FlgD immunoglobulin-like domain containing protein [Candidatus Kapaibacterium sp.]
MKRFFLLFAVALAMVATVTYAKDGKQTEDELLRRSAFFEPNPFRYNTSFPYPFSELGNPKNQAAISTGYYFVDSDDEAPDKWRPFPDIVDTTDEPTRWRRIEAGPRIVPQSYWANNPQEGLRFFRNPADDFFDTPIDSTDDAIAGPIPIGFPFFFNGIRFDSFYVSTNGIIALTNRRYFYNTSGDRTIPQGSNSAYDPMSLDWFQRNRTGDGLNDQLADDFGYTYAVLGGDPDNTTGGIRRRGGPLNNLPNRAAVIAPFFGDLHLSQFDKNMNQPEDFGKVYFKRSADNNTLIVYFVNIAPVRGLGTPYGNYNGPFDLRPGMQNYISANAQVLLNRLDSSVTVTFERFDGVAIVNGRGVPASTIFRYNTACGVRGYARHTNYGISDEPELPWAGAYDQVTHYYQNYANPNSVYPHNQLAVKFKQWQNSLRVVDIQYRVRELNDNASLDYTEQVPSTEVNDFELLAGNERIGAIQPVAIVQNLTNEVQGPSGVNFVPQELNFRSRFRIVNEANGRIIYNRVVPIDSTCLSLPDDRTEECTGDADVKVRYSRVESDNGNYTAEPMDFPGEEGYNGIPPYGFVQVYFPPFEPNEFVENQIGRMRAFIVADPTNPSTGESLGDEWPFDDTASVRLFVMNRLKDFEDDVTEFHIINRVPMPSVYKWVNIEGEVAPGSEVSNYPLPPRGEYVAANNENYRLNSPVIRLNRIKLDRSEPDSYPGGDELRSFPIDMRGKYGAVLSFSIQRTVRQDDWPRGWCDQQLIGPEPRTIVNSDEFSNWTNYAYSAARFTDEIAVELALPSPDQLNYITNIPDDRWRNHPRRDGADPETGMPAFSLFGAGGYKRGFLEEDKDSALAPPEAPEYGGLRPNVFDDGIDFEYERFFVEIPDTFINYRNDGARNFRFRIKVYASNDKIRKGNPILIPDDDDPFFIDNIKILTPTEVTDLAISAVKIHWPYTVAPASQATDVPIIVKVSNNTSRDAPPFTLKAKVRRGESLIGWPLYCRAVNIPGMRRKHVQEMTLPAWNAKLNGPGQYRIQAMVIMPGGDLEPLNDTTFTDVRLEFGEVFAYDPVQQPRNDVPDPNFTGIPGRGLNLFGFAWGGRGNISGQNGDWDGEQHSAGYRGGSGSGQIAMRFDITNTDTIRGYRAFFGQLNSAPDWILLSVYTGDNQPSQRIQATRIMRQRGIGVEDPNDLLFDQYITYMLDEPVVLAPGRYWAVIAQLGETGLELAGSRARMGMRTTRIYIPPPVNAYQPVGQAGTHLMIDKQFRVVGPGDNLINDNYFAFENTMGNGQWMYFMPTAGNPAYAHLHHFGITPADGMTATLSRGTWIPMIRPYFGPKSYGTSNEQNPCPDDIPVELTSFDGEVRANGIDLFWETASEINNAGFNVERRVFNNNDNEEWTTLDFVEGKGTTKAANHYNYFDADVTLNTTYQYRLRQFDRDGTQSCYTSHVITKKYDKALSLTIEPNKPNPFTNSTVIGFNVPVQQHVKLEVLDVYGNHIATLVNETLSATHHEVTWHGTLENGTKASSGTYIYRLTAGNEVVTGKMTLIR